MLKCPSRFSIIPMEKGKSEGLGVAFTRTESDKLVNVYECNVCHVLFGKHAPQCPVCHHGALSMVGSIVPEREQEQPL
jgi:rubrerythrin